MPYTLTFSTRLRVAPAEAWDWITSSAGIDREMSPYMRMSGPAGGIDLAAGKFEAGKPMFRSWLLLFGVLPFDYSDLTLLSIEEGVGFVEQSPMGSMRLWRHERRIVPDSEGCIITDELSFEPRFAGWLSFRFVRAFFRHRHRMLAKHLGSPGDCSDKL